MMPRQCGDCQLCCKLVPVQELDKAAGQRCKHQRTGKGCLVYRTKRMPMCCKLWTCRWLAGDDTAELSRPDRSRYVLDVMPDHITIQYDAGEKKHIQVVQIWVDPGTPDAHRDPALRRYLERRGEEGVAALVRWDNRRGMVIFPPNMSADGQWHETGSQNLNPDEQHSIYDTIQALGMLAVVAEFE